MKQDQFLVDYFNGDDTVTVNARVLQEIIKEKQRLELVLKDMRRSVKLLNSELLAKHIEAPIHVNLDVRG